jgi:hypothetical protein
MLFDDSSLPPTPEHPQPPVMEKPPPTPSKKRITIAAEPRPPVPMVVQPPPVWAATAPIPPAFPNALMPKKRASSMKTFYNRDYSKLLDRQIGYQDQPLKLNQWFTKTKRGNVPNVIDETETLETAKQMAGSYGVSKKQIGLVVVLVVLGATIWWYYRR